MKPSKANANWRELVPPYTVGLHGFTYYDVPYGKDQWVDPIYCYPRKFDLVTLQLEASEISGWWDGHQWDGYRLDQNDIVSFWRKKIDLTQY